MTSFGIIIFIYLGAIRSDFTDYFFDINDSIKIQTYIYYNLCNLFFICGYLLFINSKFTSPKNIKYYSNKNLFYLLLFIFVLITVFLITENRWILKLNLSLFILLIEFYENKETNILSRILIFLTVSFLIYLFFLNVSRFYWTPIVLITFLVYFNFQKKLNFFYLFFLSISIYVLGSLAKTISLYKKGFEASFKDEFFKRLFNADFLDSYDNLLNIFQTFPSKLNFLMGETFIGVALTFIPRIYWPEKPWVFGRVVGEYWYPSMPGQSLATTFHGELYGNFGFIGGILAIFVFGIAISLINNKLQSSANNIIKYYVAANALIFIRGDSLLIDFVYVVIIPYIIFSKFFIIKIKN